MLLNHLVAFMREQVLYGLIGGHVLRVFLLLFGVTYGRHEYEPRWNDGTVWG